MESGDIAPCSMVKWSQYVHKHLLPAWGPTYIQRRQCVILSVCCCGIFLFRTGCQLTTWSVSVAQDSHWHQVMLIATTSSKCLCQRRTRPRYILHCKGQVVWVTGSKKNFLPLSFPLLWRPLRLVVTASWLRLKKKGMNKEISVDFHKKPDLHIEQTTSICSAHQWELFFFFRPQIQCAPKKISSRHYDTSDPICYENRWGCVFNWLLSTAHSIAAKQLNHNTTSVLEMKQRRFVLSVCQGGWTATGKYSARLTHCYCLYKHTHNCCRYENWLAWVGLL